MVKRTGICVDDWVWEEILQKAKNKSALIQEALIKLHFKKQNLKTKKALSDNGPVVSEWNFPLSNIAYSM